MKGRKHEQPFKLGFSFDEALHRLVSTSPAELAESIEAEKKSREAIQKSDQKGTEAETVERSS